MQQQQEKQPEQQRVLLLQLKGPPFNLQEVVSHRNQENIQPLRRHTCAGMWAYFRLHQIFMNSVSLGLILACFEGITPNRVLLDSVSGWTEQTSVNKKL